MVSTAIKIKKKHLAITCLILVAIILTLIVYRPNRTSLAKKKIHLTNEIRVHFKDSNGVDHLIVPEQMSNVAETSNVVDETSEEIKVVDDNNDIADLKNDDLEVPVAIVDEHQEVIPYWYKAVSEKIIKEYGNTLIHIDAHSDMATPEDYEIFKEFQHLDNAPRHFYLPLMQRNDVFILSAIMKKLINHVVWVRPSWLNHSRYTSFAKSYVGTYLNEKMETVVCECMSYVSKKRNKTSEAYCSVANPDAEDIKDVQVKVDAEQCIKIHDFTMIVISEEKFNKKINLKRVNNLFVDIDEDYFGVESGVQKFIDNGLGSKTLELIDAFLDIYCPESINTETELAQYVRELFKYLNSLQYLAVESRTEKFKNKLNDLTKPYICTHVQLDQDLIKKIVAINKTELYVLSKAKYCRANSPVMMYVEPGFELCHGTIYPEDTLNQIYVGDENEIRTRGKQLSNMIQFIYNHTQPRLFTIARSLRDGYTPRRQQRFIEKTILENLDIAIKKQGKKMNVIYDDNLVFGKNGWS